MPHEQATKATPNAEHTTRTTQYDPSLRCCNTRHIIKEQQQQQQPQSRGQYPWMLRAIQARAMVGAGTPAPRQGQ